MPLVPGQHLAHYEILAPIGAGGMGEVFRARDTKLGREVAIKILPSSLARDPERLARFEREAKVLASLNHPSIAAIYGLEETADGSALVMELVPGETLKRPLPLLTALDYSRQIAEALESAHEKGIIHRDLKPGNIMVTPDGIIKVLDFGLAAVGGGSSSPGTDPENSPTLTMGATRAGTILGTAAYMSPEQASGKSVDRRGDIWSYGVVLWEMLSGERLFSGETTSHTLAEVLKTPVDFNKLPADTPRAIRDLLKRCLDRDVKTRLRDIGEARVAIQRSLVSNSQLADEGTVAAAAAPSHPRTGWIAAAVVTAAAAGLGFVAFRPVPAPVPEITRFEIHAPAGATLPLGPPAVSPDGRTIAFVATDKDQARRLYIRTLDAVEARVLQGTEGARHPFFSPDGRSIAFSADGRLKRVDIAGGTPRALVESGSPWQGAWGQNGVLLYGGGQVLANSGTATPLVLNHPYFLPDGKRYLTRTEDGNKIELGTLGSNDRTPLLDIADTAAFITTTPGGSTYMLYLRGATLMAHQFDEATGKLSGEPAVIVDGVGRVANPPVTPTVGVSQSGTLAFQRSSAASDNLHLTWVDRTGKTLGEFSGASGSEPVLSPDGQSLALTRNSDPTVWNPDIWIVDLKRGASRRLTLGSGSESGPAWTADGRRVSYRGASDAFSIEASGQGAETLALAGGTISDWSPDGKYLISGGADRRLALVPIIAGKVVDDQKPIAFGSSRGRHGRARFSPDGKYVAYTSDESGRNEIYVESIPPGAGRWQVSTNGGTGAKWRRDGKELFFSTANSLLAVDVTSGTSFLAGIPRELFKRDFNVGYDVSPDGQRFLISPERGSEADSPIVVVQNWWVALLKK